MVQLTTSTHPYPQSPAGAGGQQGMDPIRRSSSFQSYTPTTDEGQDSFRRRGSLPDLVRFGGPFTVGDTNRRLTRVLLNVTVQRSPGPVQLFVGPDSTVADLVHAAVDTYVKEGRRPPLSAGRDAAGYELHYSQFSLECLNRDEKVVNLWSRNFFLCAKQTTKSPEG